MKENSFTFEEYADALKCGGPKMRQMVIDRAAADANLGFENFRKLDDLYWELERKEKK